MASGHMNRVKRPDTWLHRPMLRNVKKVLANAELSTHENWECLNSRTSSVCGLLRYHGANARPEKIMPLGVNPFRRGSYPANTVSVPQSNREQRSP
jgi:hypothetical protein